MNYQLEKIAKSLKNARVTKGISQRELSTKSGVPQSHISKIEQGRVDLRITSLLAIATTLGLELELIPKKVKPAIDSIIRTNQNADSARLNDISTGARKKLSKIQKELDKVAMPKIPGLEVDKMQRRIRELQNFTFNKKYLSDLDRIAKHINTISKSVIPEIDAFTKVTKEIDFQNKVKKDLDAFNEFEKFKKIQKEIDTLRNGLAHSSFPISNEANQKPRYTLDED